VKRQKKILPKNGFYEFNERHGHFFVNEKVVTGITAHHIKRFLYKLVLEFHRKPKITGRKSFYLTLQKIYKKNKFYFKKIE
jgi:hypothetical protein